MGNMIQDFFDWVTAGITFGNLVAFTLVLIVFRDRLFGHVSLKTLKEKFDSLKVKFDSHEAKFDSHEAKNEEAHRDLGAKIDAVRDDTQYMRGVLDTLKERMNSSKSSRGHH